MDKEQLARLVTEGVVVLQEDYDRLVAESQQMQTWNGLMTLLDKHWPEDIFPMLQDNPNRDTGPRILSLIRWVDRLKKQNRIMHDALLKIGHRQPKMNDPGELPRYLAKDALRDARKVK